MRILGLCGSLQQQSANLELLQTAAKLTAQDTPISIFTGIRELPFFNPDIDGADAPNQVREWRVALAECDAVFIASPEYGHSLPGVLKNAIDWVVGSGELYGKPVAITAAVPAPDRGQRGLAALRTTLQAVEAVVVGGKPIVRGPNFRLDIDALLEELLAVHARLSEPLLQLRA